MRKIEARRDADHGRAAGRGPVALLLLACLAAPARGEGGVSLPLATLSQSPYCESFGASLTASEVNAADALAYPAYAGFIDRKSASFGHAALFSGGAYDAAGFAYPTMSRGTWAVGLYRMNSGAAEQRDSLGNETGSYRDEQTLLRLAYGDHVRPHLAWGLSLDYSGHSLAGSSSRALSGGAGLQYRRGRFSAGAAADNLLEKTSGETSDRPTAQGRVNFAMTFFERLLVGVDAVVVPQLDLRTGLQYSLFDAFAVRLGRGEGGIGAGIGLKIRDYRIDYNMTIHDLGLASKIGLTVFFGASRAAQREARAEDLYREARRLVVEGRYAAAARAMAESGRYSALPLDRRTFLESLRNLEQAGVLELVGNGPQVNLRKGIGYYLEQKAELARAMFLTVSAQDPSSDMVKRLIALVSRPQDFPAAPSFVDIDPIRLKLFKVDEYFSKNQLDLALKECREIIALDPSSVIGHVRLGSVYYSLGIKTEAVKAWMYAAKLDPKDADVRKAIAFMRAEGIGETPTGSGEPK